MQKIKSFGKIKFCREKDIFFTANYFFKHKNSNYNIDRDELETLMFYKCISEAEFQEVINTFNTIVEIAITNSKDIISIATTSNNIKITTIDNKITIIYLREMIIKTDDESLMTKIEEYFKD